MGRTACTEPQCLYKGDLYLYLFMFFSVEVRTQTFRTIGMLFDLKRLIPLDIA
jgi:hypothetical protein